MTEPEQASTGEEGVKRPRRWWQASFVALVIVLAWVTYFWWPRKMPDYIVLPAGHSEVQVKSWVGGLYYRQFYVRTQVARPAREVLAELTKSLAPLAHKSIYGRLDEPWMTELNGVPLVDFTAWPTACRQWGEKAGYCEAKAHAYARPTHPYAQYGEMLPQSYLSFWLEGPRDVNRAENHFMFYRLIPRDENVTTVEIWDLRCFDV